MRSQHRHCVTTAHQSGSQIADEGAGSIPVEARIGLSEKEYFQFTARLYDPFRVRDIAVELRDTNRQKNRAKLRLSFDDKRIVRGRVATNQPLTFYVGRNRIPYELVINEVEKGRIWGYVSVPVGSTSSAY